MSVWPKSSPWIVLKRRKRSSRWEVFCEKVFLQISQNSQENTCARVSFPWIFAKFLIIPFIIEHLWWLLLNFWNSFQLCYKRTPVQVFSYEFCKTSENSFSVKQSKTISSDLYCSTPCLSSSFVYYSWKSLFLQNILEGLRDNPVLQNTDLWYNNTIPPFWEGNLSIC